ncbi:MAG: hypothetical protein HC838_05255 [Spirulinaceae cyanobacterium RM2_2_10]|nr:hypothetical protein [Spirulinaceae cyanobacterium RM2_2_10]
MKRGRTGDRAQARLTNQQLLQEREPRIRIAAASFPTAPTSYPVAEAGQCRNYNENT